MRPSTEPSTRKMLAGLKKIQMKSVRNAANKELNMKKSAVRKKKEKELIMKEVHVRMQKEQRRTVVGPNKRQNKR